MFADLVKVLVIYMFVWELIVMKPNRIYHLVYVLRGGDDVLSVVFAGFNFDDEGEREGEKE